MRKAIIVDMFAGAGGESTGLRQALEEAEVPYEIHAINHWELARAQAFPDDYVFLGNKAEQTKQIGNAVPPVVPRAIARQYTEELKGWLNNYEN